MYMFLILVIFVMNIQHHKPYPKFVTYSQGPLLEEGLKFWGENWYIYNNKKFGDIEKK